MIDAFSETNSNSKNKNPFISCAFFNQKKHVFLL